MMTGKFIVERDKLAVLSRECENVFDIEKRLPDFVFRRSFDKYFAIESVCVFKKEFGDFLFSLSNIFGDKFINFMTLLADPVNEHHRKAALAVAVSFDAEDISKKYLPTMHYNGTKFPHLAYGTDIGIFWGSSFQWGIFYDRISWEMAVIAVSDDVDVPIISEFRCMDAASLSAYVKSQYHWNTPISIDFNKRFLKNYPI